MRVFVYLVALVCFFNNGVGITQTHADEVDSQVLVQSVISGRVIYPDGSPASGARVTLLSYNGTAISGQDGTFEFNAEVPISAAELAVVASLSTRETDSATNLVATSAGLSRARDGVVDAGLMRLDSLCEPSWQGGLSCLNGLNGGPVLAAVSWNDGTGEALYVAGQFTLAGCATVTNIARWDGMTWSPMGGGLGGGPNTVNALAVYDDGTGPTLYAGGSFTLAGGMPANGIARWNGTEWSPLEQGGLGGVIYALAVYDDGNGPALYAGGSFFGFVPPLGLLFNIGRWDGTSWTSLNNGVDGVVYALTVFEDGNGSALIAGGQFSSAGGVPASKIARWNGTVWSSLGSGLPETEDSTILALGVHDDGSGSALYAAGAFSQIDGKPASNIARWDGLTWSALDSGLNSTVFALASFDDGTGPLLYAGGFFTNVGGSTADRIARWDGISWSPVGGGVLFGTVDALAVHDDGSGPALYVGGGFVQVGVGVPARGIAQWDGTDWSTLSTDVNDRVFAVEVFDDGSGPALYVGGRFTQAGGTPANRIARWDGITWSTVGAGLGTIVTALTVYNDGNGPALYAGGGFSQASGGPGNRIARWDGSEWLPLGSGLNNTVNALAVFDDGSGPALYAGGSFTLAGGMPASRIARWDGTSWSALDSGVDGLVSALAVFNDGSGSALYAGGRFAQAGGSPAGRIARWDGSSWSAVGEGLQTGGTTRVEALAVFNDGSGPAIYAGGVFSTAGAIPVNNIARWDGTSWSSVGAGVNNTVLALTVFNDGSGPALHAGGSFTQAGGIAASNIARWDGDSWSPLGLGTTGNVNALVVLDDGDSSILYAGGDFPFAGGLPSSFIAQWVGCPTTDLPPVAISGGPYAFTAAHGDMVSLDATASNDPDATKEGLFNGIVSLQWDLGGDGPDSVDENYTSPMQKVTIGDAAAKGLSVVTDVPLWLTVTDADGLSDTDQTGLIRYINSSPTAEAGGPYAKVQPGGSLELTGEVTDPDLGFPVGEVVSIEWDTSPATTLSEIGDGFASSAVASVPYDTLLEAISSKTATIWLNAGDRSGELANASVDIELAAADLIATAPIGPSEIVAGSTIEITWNEQNIGDAPAAGGREARIYLSPDKQFSPGSDLLLASIVVPDVLKPGAGIPLSVEVDIPATSSGPRWLIAITDAANAVPEPFGGEDNNAASTSVKIEVLPSPDLEVLAVEPNGSSVIGGQPVQLTYTVTNSGVLPATSPWFDAVFLSEDETIDPSDTQLLLTPANAAPLDPGQSYTRTVNLPVPSDFVGGPRFLIVRADNGNAILDGNATNNALASPIEVLPTPAPDLANTLITSAPSTAVFGDPIEVSWTAQNIGTLTLDSVWTDVVVLSLDTTLGPGDILIGSTPINVGPLKPDGNPYEASLSATLPLNANVQPGEYYVLVRADGGGSVVELDETNNLDFFGPIQVDLPPLPDLVPQNIAAPKSVEVGETVAIDFEVANIGSSDSANPFDVLLYAKAPGAGGNGILIGVTTVNTGLKQGQVVPLSITGTVPEVGTLDVQFTICVDPDNQVLETNTSNNCASGGPVGFRRPNLRVVDIVPPASVVEAGSSVTFEVVITNTGSAPAVPSPVWIDGLLLSPDEQIGADLLIGSAPRVLPVPAGGSYIATVVCVIPESFQGTYWLVAQANRTGSLIESDSTDNLYLSPMAIEVVQPDRPNLVVSEVMTPIPGVLGAPVELTWEITNIGAAPATGFWIDDVYASADPFLGAAARKVGSAEFIGTLKPGESRLRTVTVTYPLTPGDYFFIVQTDASGTLIEGFEGQENDNTRSTLQPVIVENFQATLSATVFAPDALNPRRVLFQGDATLEGTSTPAAFAPVEIRIENQGFVRRLAVITDQNGSFTKEFPLVPTESGFYAASAGPAWVADLPVSAEYEIYGLDVSPRTGPGGTPITLRVFPGQSVTRTLELRNLGDNILEGVMATIGNLPQGVSAQITQPPSLLAPLERVQLNLVVTASADANANAPLMVDFSASQATPVQANFAVLVPEPASNLLPPPSSQLEGGRLKSGMLVGDITYVQFEFTNAGGAPSGPVTVEIPSAPWLSVVTQNPLPSVPPGGTASVVLALSPAEDLPLGPYLGDLNVVAADSGFTLAFNFVAVSDGIGGIRVRATDEFSYYDVPPGEIPDPTTPNGPKIAFAEVKVRDLATNELVALGFTDLDGVIEFVGLEEKFYQVEVSSPDHGGFQSAVRVFNGEVAFVDAFLPRQLVNYVWQVIATEIEDEYIINIQAQFQTFVPAPVIVVDPTLIDLTNETSNVVQRNITVTNYGLITAENVRLNLPETLGEWQVIPLVEEIGDLPGGCEPGSLSGSCSVSVPVLFVLDPVVANFRCSSASGNVSYDVQCGQTYTINKEILLRDTIGCLPSLPPSGGPVFQVPSGGVGQPSFIAPSQPLITQNAPCGGCGRDCLISAAGCIPVIGQAPQCVAGFAPCAESLFEAIQDPTKINIATPIFECLGAGIDCIADVFTFAYGCICGLSKDCLACYLFGQDSCVRSVFVCSLGDVITTSWDTARFCLGLRGRDDQVEAGDVVVRSYLSYYGPSFAIIHALGIDDWNGFSSDDAPALKQWMSAFSQAVSLESSEGIRISKEEANVLKIEQYPSNFSEEIIDQVVARWNLSADLWASGILMTEDIPEELVGQVVSWESLWSIAALAFESQQLIQSYGFGSSQEAMEYSLALVEDSVNQNAGICASVTIEISQSLTLTRSAFEASLLVENEAGQSLDAFTVELFIRDADGQISNVLFAGADAPIVEGIGGIGGSSSLSPGQSASIAWTLIPFDEAAPDVTTPYTVSGKISYFFGGSLVEVPLFPVPISVVPNPALELKYFLETLVFSDDPFTPEVEPAVPFSLGLLVANTGAGPANNLSIASSQPTIIENELGLVVDFQIVGTRLNLDPLLPSLNVNLGNVDANDTATAQWSMISSLQGEFVSYSAEFEHVSPFAQPELSLIRSVDVFGLTRVVFDDESTGVGSDGQPLAPIQKPSFLTDQFPDVDDLPDTLHTPDNNTAPVTAITSSGVGVDMENLTATVSVNMPSGYAYIRIDDPFNGAYPLNSVTRTDGKQINTQYNAWQTRRILRPLGQPEVNERLLHIFDSNGPGEYVVSFNPDNTPPTVSSFLAIADHALDGLSQVPVALGASGLLSEPRQGVQQLLIEFDKPIDPVTFTKASVLICGFGADGLPVQVPVFAVSLRTDDRVGIIDFASPLPDVARYCVQFVGVRDLAGNLLDGASSRQRFSQLLGDSTGDQRVTNTDVGGVLSLVGTDPIDPQDLFQVRSDINRDGRIDMDDVDLVLARRGLSTRSIEDPCGCSAGDPDPLIDYSEDVSNVAAKSRGKGDHPQGLAGPNHSESTTKLAGNVDPEKASKSLDPQDTDDASNPGLGRFTNHAGVLVQIDSHWIAVRDDRMDIGVSSVAETLDSYGFDHAEIVEADVPDWWVARLPSMLQEPQHRRSFAESMTQQGIYVSPLVTNSDTGDLYAIDQGVVLTVAPGVPADWMDRVFAMLLPADAHIHELSNGLDPFTPDEYEVRMSLGAQAVIALVELLMERRELSSVRPLYAGPLLATAADPLFPPADMNSDGKIDLEDLTIFISLFGTDAAEADLNGDGSVDTVDLQILLQQIHH